MFWKYVQERTKQTNNIQTLTDSDRNCANTDSKMANMLNNYFSSAFINENKDNLPVLDEGVQTQMKLSLLIC